MKNSTAATFVTANVKGMALSQAVAEAYISRASAGSTSNPVRRAHLEISGQYVVKSSGEAEVVVVMDPSAFRRAMAVREINKQIDGKYSVDLSTATLAAHR